ncbi:hypothetical protein EJ05DRAFT_245401 [Pseudovirgaria hyperparasitica]|uniref:Uncharacterized protein n=1 Tax=Pseudovirgaria hyperparasitica TaxID=470096 RepID=A0A6A6WG21_9PEZI|nr:uncharacterized protein EJ05DRAFT_245401 [Pseudovirgaria hyperparasitica]KAF2760886.1 hypothetical protein EJ05DRAFT_245401 [Pseudovirgaria hyperparasitica]
MRIRSPVLAALLSPSPFHHLASRCPKHIRCATAVLHSHIYNQRKNNHSFRRLPAECDEDDDRQTKPEAATSSFVPPTSQSVRQTESRREEKALHSKHNAMISSDMPRSDSLPRSFFADRLNPPISTLPPPLENLPPRSDYNWMIAYLYTCGQIYYRFYKAALYQLWNNRKILRALGPEPILARTLRSNRNPIPSADLENLGAKLLAKLKTNTEKSMHAHIAILAPLHIPAGLDWSHPETRVGSQVVLLPPRQDYKHCTPLDWKWSNLGPNDKIQLESDPCKSLEHWQENWDRITTATTAHGTHTEKATIITLPEYCRAEFQFRERTKRDLRRLVPFATILLVLGEWTPLIVAFVTPLVPRVCWLPTQQSKMIQSRERFASQNELSFVRRRAQRNQNLALHMRERLAGQLRPNWLRFKIPMVFVGTLLQRVLRYLDFDDALIRRDGGVAGMTDAEVHMAAVERSIRVSDRHHKDIREDLDCWVRKGGWRSLLNYSEYSGE